MAEGVLHRALRKAAAMTDKRRQWTVISQQQLVRYIEESQKLCAFAEEHDLTIVGAALGGVALIRSVLEVAGGLPEWWCGLITCENPSEFLTAIAFSVVPDNVADPDCF